MNASSKWASCASSPRVRPRLRWTSPRSGSSRPDARRSSVVLPAPFGPTRPIRSPRAIEASMASRMTKVPTSRVTPVRRRMLIGRVWRPRRAPTRARPHGGWRRHASFARSVPARRPGRLRRPVSPTVPSPPSSVQRRPARRGPPVIVRRIAAAPFRSAALQPLAPRAEVGRPRPDDDPLDRPAAARTRLAGPLVDLQVLLHRAVAIGRRVVVDRAAAPLDGLAEDPPERLVQVPLVGGAERAGGPQRVQPGRPERLVRVDVADAGEERLVEQQRLEPALRAAEGSGGSRAP